MLGLAELFDRGGPVLYILFIVTLFIWFIIFSKYLMGKIPKMNENTYYQQM